MIFQSNSLSKKSLINHIEPGIIAIIVIAETRVAHTGMVMLYSFSFVDFHGINLTCPGPVYRMEQEIFHI